MIVHVIQGWVLIDMVFVILHLLPLCAFCLSFMFVCQRVCVCRVVVEPKAGPLVSVFTAHDSLEKAAG